MYDDRPTPSQQPSPTRGGLVLVFSKLVACVRLMVALFFAVVADGCALVTDFSAFLEARVFSFKVIDVTS